MGIECDYNFDDLYFAATGHHMSTADRAAIDAASQDERNQLVKQWVVETYGSFRCEDRRGSDNQTYTAFWAIQEAGEVRRRTD